MKIINKPIGKWLRFIDEATDECSDQIISLYDLSDLIKNIFEDDDCPFKGLKVTIKHYEVEFCSGTLGELSNDSNVKKDPLGTTAECVIEYELKVKITSSTLWYNKFIVFLTSVWLPNLRKFGGLNLKQDELAALLPEALKGISMNSLSQINCIFADLDKFKKINDELGHDIGDEAIQDVLGCIEKAAQDERIISTIDGGDEYIIFIEDKGDTKLLLTLDRLRKLIADNKYGDKKLTVGII